MTQLTGNAAHSVRVSERAKQVWPAVPWGPDRNVIRKMCNDGASAPKFCDAAVDFVTFKRELIDDEEWADADKLPGCVDGAFEPNKVDGYTLLRIGRWLLFCEFKEERNRVDDVHASLHDCEVIDIMFVGRIFPPRPKRPTVRK